MDFKQRLKQKYTTIIGAIIMLIGTGLFIAARFTDRFEFSVYELGFTLVVGWVFLMAKNSLIEGVFGGLIKPKE